MQWAPPWWAASILANFTIAAIEGLNRNAGFTNFGNAIVCTMPLIFAAQYGLFYAWRDAPSMMMAWAFFTAGNSVLRLLSVQYYAGEPLNVTTLAGTAVIFFGAWIVKQGH